MKKKFTFLVLAILIIVSLSGCGEEKKPVSEGNLKVTVTYWNGWDPDYESPVEEYYFDVKTSDTIVVEGDMTGDFSFKIKRASKEEIIVKSEYPLEISNGSGINLQSNQREFTVKFGEPLSLVTITMDAGTFYTFEICEYDE